MGVDLSRPMIELARRLAVEHGVDNAEFEQGDAQIHPFVRESFDVAISRTGTMFFGNPAAAFANIARAIRPGGRLTMLVWQGPQHNEWIREFTTAFAAGRNLPPPPVGAPGPFALADPDRVRALLAGASFSDVELDPRHASMWFGADVDDAYGFVLGLMGWMLDGLDGDARTRALDDLRATITAHQTREGVTYGSGAWLVRARRP